MLSLVFIHEQTEGTKLPKERPYIWAEERACGIPMTYDMRYLSKSAYECTSLMGARVYIHTHVHSPTRLTLKYNFPDIFKIASQL